MKVPIKDMVSKVRSILPVEHRLEMKKVGNIMMIDDAYNSNPTGARNALDVLGMMPGIKVVVTPGMIELGESEKTLNYEFGTSISKVADYVILIGEKRCLDIKRGVIDGGFSDKKIMVLNRVSDAYYELEKIKSKNSDKEVYALFENDLPDIYSEGGK